MRELAPETVIDDRYEIIARIGSGGMADVYCARGPPARSQGGPQAAATAASPRTRSSSSASAARRRRAAGLQHSNVVGVFDRGEWDGTYYIAMEYLEGVTLKQLINTRGPLAPLDARSTSPSRSCGPPASPTVAASSTATSSRTT